MTRIGGLLRLIYLHGRSILDGGLFVILFSIG